MRILRESYLLCAVLCVAMAARAELPATQGSQSSATVELERAIRERGLHLSNDARSVAKRFDAVVTLIVPIKGLGQQITSYNIARDQDEVAILTRSAKGASFAYATQALFCGFDLVRRGELIMYEQGAPVIIFGLNQEDTGLEFDFSFRRREKVPRVELAIDAVIQEGLRRAESVEFSGDTTIIRIQTNRSELWVKLAIGGGVSELVIKSKAGPIISITGIRTAGERSPILGFRAVDFHSLGIPVRAGEPTGVSQIPLLVPRSFAAEEPESSASERLGALFKRLGPPPSVEDTAVHPFPRDSSRSALDAAVGLELLTFDSSGLIRPPA